METVRSKTKSSADAEIAEDVRVISAETYRNIQDFDVRLSAAKQNMQDEEQRCRSRLAKLRDEAWNTGFQQGVNAAHERSCDYLRALDTQCRSSEAGIVDLVVDVVRKLLGDLTPRQVAPGLVRQTLAQIREQHTQLSVYVSPCVRDAVERQLADLNGTSLRILLEDDDSLEATDCRVETSLGIIEAGLETQLQALRRSLNPGGAADGDV